MKHLVLLLLVACSFENVLASSRRLSLGSLGSYFGKKRTPTVDRLPQGEFSEAVKQQQSDQLSSSSSHLEKLQSFWSDRQKVGDRTMLEQLSVEQNHDPAPNRRRFFFASPKQDDKNSEEKNTTSSSDLKGQNTTSPNNNKCVNTTDPEGGSREPNHLPLKSVPIRIYPSPPWDQQQRHSHWNRRRNQPHQHPWSPSDEQRESAAAESLARVVSLVIRAFFFSWVRRCMMTREEVLHPIQKYVWENLNNAHERDGAALRNALKVPPKQQKWTWWHARKARQSFVRPSPVDLSKVYTRTVVVIPIEGEEGVPTEDLADIVSFLLLQYEARAFGVHKDSNEPMELEVVFLVESPGGAVTKFGLAASQIRRLSNVPGIVTTVCVDEIAASGGYMIASQAHMLLAAPFAMVGSIGVMGGLLNYRELAQRMGVQPITLKAGKSKNRISEWKEVSWRDIRAEEAQMSKVHSAFQKLVVKARPALAWSINKVGDGSVFLGQEALDLKLVDGVMTSDEYLLQRIQANDRVLRLHRSAQSRMPRQLKLPLLNAWPALQSRVRNVIKGLGSRQAISRGVQLLAFASLVHQQQPVLSAIFRGALMC